MRYLSIDLETTGLNPNTCQVLEVGMVVDDTDWWKEYIVESLPTRVFTVKRGLISGEPYALMMNLELLKEVCDRKNGPPTCYKEEDVIGQIRAFCEQHSVNYNKIIPAGKNFGSFDRRFLEKLPGDRVRFHHRALDPIMLWWEPFVDTEPPSTETCLKRAGLDSTIKHRALEDARNVVRLIRAFYAKTLDGEIKV